MEISLENYLRDKVDEEESMHSFEIATDTIRCWIDEYNEQLRQYNVVGLSEQLKAFADWRDENEDWIMHNCKDNNDVIKAYKQSL